MHQKHRPIHLFFLLASAKRLRICLVVLCLTAHIGLVAQEVFISPPAKLLTRFSFTTLSGGVIMLRGTVGDKPDSLNFIFDTGSSGISLDTATAAALKLNIVPSDKMIKGIAGIRKVDFVNDLTLHLPGLQTDSLDFHVNDYSLLTSTYGFPIDGIIGYSFLRKYIVYIDYDSSIMKIYKPGGIRYPRGGHLMKPTFVSLPFNAITVKDDHAVTGKFFLDTGAGLCFLMSNDFEKDSTVLKKGKKIVITQAEGIGGKQRMELTTVKMVQMGPYKFRNVPTYVFEDVNNITSYPHIGGLLGNDIMRRFNMYINYPAREFYFKPNSHYNELFDYSYTGMSLYQTTEGIIISDIQKDGPAEKSGLQEDDLIISIDNNFSGNITTYKNLLEEENTRFKLIIRRKSELVEIRLKTGSIR
jgi:predicted aspartyl protease